MKILDNFKSHFRFSVYFPFVQRRISDIQKDLNVARMHLQADEYITSIFALFTLLLILSIIIGFILIIEFYNIVFLSIIIIPFIYLYVGFKYPSIKASSRLKKIDRHLGEALRFFANLSMSNITMLEMLEEVCKEKSFSTLSDEACELVTSAKFASKDIFKILEEYLMMTTQKSKWLLFIQGLVTARKSGSIERDYILRVYEDYRNDMNIEYMKLTDTLSMYAEIFISIVVSFPLFLILVFAIMGIVSKPAIAVASMYYILLVSLLLIPLGGFMVAWLSKVAQEGY
ncbi:MAG: type II secretion system F family protein [Thermoplasmata archaeon]